MAFKFAAELDCLSKPFLATYRGEGGLPCDLPYEKKTLQDLAKTVGARPIGDVSLTAVREFMGDMITANEASRHEYYAEKLGVSDYLRKPFSMDQLIDSVNKFLRPNRDQESS